MGIHSQEQAIEHLQAIEAHIQGLEELVNAESEKLRETWSDERVQLTRARKEQYEPGSKKAGKESYSQLNFYARTWPGGMELSWYTCNYDKKGNRYMNFIAKGQNSRTTHTYYPPNLRKPARKWEWPLVKETEKQAKLLRIARAKILKIRSTLKPVKAALTEVSIENVREAFEVKKPGTDVGKPEHQAVSTDKDAHDSQVAPTPRRHPQRKEEEGSQENI